VKYTLKGKQVWWWVFNDSLSALGSILDSQGYAVVDDFYDTSTLRSDVLAKYKAGQLPTKGGLIDGRDGRNTPYGNENVRGDWIGWFDGTDEGWNTNSSLPDYLLKVSTLVEQLKEHCGGDGKGLGGIKTRSRCMVTCYPPRSRYTKHVDNGGGISNGRRLTTLIYMNQGWEKGDGGELAVYEKGGKKRIKDVEPLAGRLVLFWSDERVPHEVLESMKDRYTVTIWFFDGEEWEEAKRRGIIPKPTELESGAKVAFVPSEEHEAREPDGSDLKDVVVTNEPFVEVGETPKLNNLNTGAVKDAKDVVAPSPEAVPAPVPPAPPTISHNIDKTPTSVVVTFGPFPDLETLASSTLDVDVSTKTVIVLADGVDKVEVGIREGFDGDKVKAKMKKKRLQLIVTIER